MNNLLNTIADCESELNILEDLYKKLYESEDPDTLKLNNIKLDIKNMKIKLTKYSNELNIAKEKESDLNNV